MRQSIYSLLLCLCLHGAVGPGFDGIPGDYCKIRRPEQCCQGRDDDCTTPILGNHLCYCDIFCDRRHVDGDDDCCPDFQAVCKGRTTPPPADTGRCDDHAGNRYREGERVQLNCKSCTCGARGWVDCQPNEECLIQPELLNKNKVGRYSWQAENYTQFWGKTLKNGVTYRLGTLYPEEAVQAMHGILPPVVDNLPEQFDSREKWPQYIGPVRDQGDCGSSWAFSTISLAADRLAILSEGRMKEVLSVQQLLSCNQHRQRGCDGGYLDRAWCVVSENCYPYQSGRTNEPGQCQIPRSQYKRPEGVTCPSSGASNKIYRITPPYRMASKEEDIMAEILTNGPVQATFRVYEDFYMYKSGVYQRMTEVSDRADPERNGYHSVRVLGWGVDRSNGNSIKYWLCANSWGTGWGEQGLFKIIRGENHSEIESFVISALGQGAKRRRRRLLRKLRRRKLRRL